MKSVLFTLLIFSLAGSLHGQRPVWPYNDPERDTRVWVSRGSGNAYLGEAAARKVLLHQEPPCYPAGVLAHGLAGVVRLSVNVDANGDVEQVGMLSGGRLFYKAAADAVRRWQFGPFRWNGRPTPFRRRITVRFPASTPDG
jgi:TonB family protein